ncbi:GNAT family N-acetyltransferase [Mucilaginibacter sp.]|uniref:GNAT family N-acetyltransferase n=1 Tax=Mucilaginibacter sp. TaxID=1882438 RepID=UPI002618A1AE|nr:GNAT family N-acetyltransferase [Mucilaginibacter sp.]MDB5129573.1 N-acetyltransferase [Mucilaginibacter sp.]
MLFQSANLDIRRFNLNDDAFIFELLNTPAWKQFISDRNIDSREDAVNYILNGPLASYNKYGYGAWLVTLKDTQQPIGMCGFFKRDYLDKPDLGFAFLPGFEGRGLAYEASVASLAHIRESYDLDGLYATTTADNIRSQRLLERCGFTPTGLVTTPEAETLLLYTLSLR